ncbi:MAG TPA: DUF4349 domain-containing protein [Mycobacteriales bacterium]|nr:DUF4349 domain-containing protein [Mycobacteriales bacterium]
MRQWRWPLAGAAVAVVVAVTTLTNLGGAGGGMADRTSTASGGLAPQLSERAAAPGRPASDVAAVAAPAEKDAPRVVKVGTMTLVVDEGKVSATVQRLQVLVAGLRGYVADSTSDEASEHPSATLTYRVPVASFDTLVTQVRSLKVKVVSATESGKDVTAAYADTKAQIESLGAARDRYLDILSRARTIAETLSVQQRVDDVQQQIDRLEGQRRVLADQSDYGTLTVSVAETAGELLAHSARSGWSKAWYDAHHGFTSGVQRILAGSGRALLVLLVGAALLLLGRSGWRLAQRRLA